METINNTPTIIKAIYCGKTNNSGLKVGYEYKFELYRKIVDGYWRAKCIDNDTIMLFSCINAMYDNLKSIRMIKSDGSVVAF